MDDIVELLRYPMVVDIDISSQYATCRVLMKEAADKIEQLRADKDKMVDEIERLRREIEKFAWDRRDHDYSQRQAS